MKKQKSCMPMCVLGFVLLQEHRGNKTAQDSLCRRDCKSIKIRKMD